MASKKVLTNGGFLERVQEYLPQTASIWETDCSDQPCGTLPLESLSPNDFLLFDADTTVAFSRAIEDFALDEAHGKFLAAFQDADQFEAQHDRYWQLSSTLEDVQVIATGKLSRRTNGLSYCNDTKGLLKKFWVVVYEGIRNRVMFLAEQTNEARKFDERQYLGFYTFDQKIIDQAREDVAELLGGSCPHLKNFKRLHQLDLAAKRLHVEFARENKKLDLAIQKLRGGKKYQSQHFIEDFDKTLQRLTDLKAHLPEIIGGQRTK